MVGGYTQCRRCGCTLPAEAVRDRLSVSYWHWDSPPTVSWFCNQVCLAEWVESWNRPPQTWWTRLKTTLWMRRLRRGGW